MLVHNTNSVSRCIINLPNGGYVISTTVLKSNTSACRLPVPTQHKRIFSSLSDAEFALVGECGKIAKSGKFIVSWNHRFSFTVDKTNGDCWRIA